MTLSRKIVFTVTLILSCRSPMEAAPLPSVGLTDTERGE